MQTESWALNRVNIRVVLHSQTVSFPSASPEITKLHRKRGEGRGGEERGGERRGEGEGRGNMEKQV